MNWLNISASMNLMEVILSVDALRIQLVTEHKCVCPANLIVWGKVITFCDKL